VNLKHIAKQLLSVGMKFLDSDGDGKLEISDLPGALAKAAAWQATGMGLLHSGKALLQSGKATYDAIKAAADTGELTSGGVAVTAADVDAAWERAKVPFHTAAAEARAEMAKDAPPQ